MVSKWCLSGFRNHPQYRLSTLIALFGTLNSDSFNGNYKHVATFEGEIQWPLLNWAGAVSAEIVVFMSVRFSADSPKTFGCIPFRLHILPRWADGVV